MRPGTSSSQFARLPKAIDSQPMRLRKKRPVPQQYPSQRSRRRCRSDHKHDGNPGAHGIDRVGSGENTARHPPRQAHLDAVSCNVDILAADGPLVHLPAFLALVAENSHNLIGIERIFDALSNSVSRRDLLVPLD